MDDRNITGLHKYYRSATPYNLPESMDWRNKNAVTPVKGEVNGEWQTLCQNINPETLVQVVALSNVMKIHVHT